MPAKQDPDNDPWVGDGLENAEFVHRDAPNKDGEGGRNAEDYTELFRTMGKNDDDTSTAHLDDDLPPLPSPSPVPASTGTTGDPAALPNQGPPQNSVDQEERRAQVVTNLLQAGVSPERLGLSIASTGTPVHLAAAADQHAPRPRGNTGPPVVFTFTSDQLQYVHNALFDYNMACVPDLNVNVRMLFEDYVKYTHPDVVDALGLEVLAYVVKEVVPDSNLVLGKLTLAKLNAEIKEGPPGMSTNSITIMANAIVATSPVNDGQIIKHTTASTDYQANDIPARALGGNAGNQPVAAAASPAPKELAAAITTWGKVKNLILNWATQNDLNVDDPETFSALCAIARRICRKRKPGDKEPFMKICAGAMITGDIEWNSRLNFKPIFKKFLEHLKINYVETDTGFRLLLTAKELADKLRDAFKAYDEKKAKVVTNLLRAGIPPNRPGSKSNTFTFKANTKMIPGMATATDLLTKGTTALAFLVTESNGVRHFMGKTKYSDLHEFKVTKDQQDVFDAFISESQVYEAESSRLKRIIKSAEIDEEKNEAKKELAIWESATAKPALVIVKDAKSGGPVEIHSIAVPSEDLPEAFFVTVAKFMNFIRSDLCCYHPNQAKGKVISKKYSEAYAKVASLQSGQNFTHIEHVELQRDIAVDGQKVAEENAAVLQHDQDEAMKLIGPVFKAMHNIEPALRRAIKEGYSRKEIEAQLDPMIEHLVNKSGPFSIRGGPGKSDLVFEFERDAQLEQALTPAPSPLSRNKILREVTHEAGMSSLEFAKRTVVLNNRIEKYEAKAIEYEVALKKSVEVEEKRAAETQSTTALDYLQQILEILDTNPFGDLTKTSPPDWFGDKDEPITAKNAVILVKHLLKNDPNFNGTITDELIEAYLPRVAEFREGINEHLSSKIYKRAASVTEKKLTAHEEEGKDPEWLQRANAKKNMKFIAESLKNDESSDSNTTKKSKTDGSKRSARPTRGSKRNAPSNDGLSESPTTKKKKSDSDKSNTSARRTRGSKRSAPSNDGSSESPPTKKKKPATRGRKPPKK